MSTLEKIKYNRITRSTNYTWRCPNWKDGACHKGNAVCFEIDECEAYHRLEELEDKIESGELAEVPDGSVVLTREEAAEYQEYKRIITEALSMGIYHKG